jgi:hypothetical protein
MNKRKRKKQLNIHNEKMYNDCFNLDSTICKFVLPRLKWFKKNAMGYPDGSFETFEDYQEAIQEMINYFEQDAYAFEELSDKGIMLFAKNFRSLWM